MIKAVLLDLDDTLLRIDTDAFVQAYLTQLVGFVVSRHPELAAETVKRGILGAIRSAIRDLDPARTNAAVFGDSISAALDLPAEAINAVLADFFATGYAELRGDAAPVEGVRDLIDQLMAAGLIVVIATNPLFPQEAVVGRMAWADIDIARTPPALITSIEKVHFTKPNPHYYEEILARIGVEADEALMVGDSIENDIIPAAAAGLNTFWIHLDRALPPEVTPDGVGTLRDLSRCIGERWLATLTPRPRTAAQLGPRLLGNLAALDGLVQTIAPAQWAARPDPKEWSPLEIICHLRDSERAVQRARLLQILHEDNPFIPPPPPNPAPGERDLSGEDGLRALAQFAVERRETLTLLASLNEADWTRPARHSIFGPTTLLEMAHFTARHDRLHITQLCETIGRCVVT